MEKILIYHIKDDWKVKKAAEAMKIRVEEIIPADLKQSIGNLAEGKKSVLMAPFEGSAPKESLLVVCDVSEKHMDRLLFQFRQIKLSVDYKAILTPTNRSWTVLMLLLELGREKRSMS